MAIGIPVKLGTNTGTGTTSVVLTLTTGVPSGDDVVVCVTWAASAGGTLSVRDSKSNTYTQRVAMLAGVNTLFGAIYSSHLSNSLISGDTITFTTTTSVNAIVLAAYDVSGLQTISFDQATSSGQVTTSTPSSGNVTTTSASEILFGLLHATGTPTAGSGYTTLDHNATFTSHVFDSEYQIVSSTGTYAANWTGIPSQPTQAAIATFKGATGTAPVNTVAPAISGTQHVGQVLTTTNGTWTDDGSPTFTYQWQRDNSGGGVYSDITGATSSTYTLAAPDDTCNVRCNVTDSTLDGNSLAHSNALAITYAAPTNTVAPVVSGIATVGVVLSCDTGSWTT